MTEKPMLYSEDGRVADLGVAREMAKKERRDHNLGDGSSLGRLEAEKLGLEKVYGGPLRDVATFVEEKLEEGNLEAGSSESIENIKETARQAAQKLLLILEKAGSSKDLKELIDYISSIGYRIIEDEEEIRDIFQRVLTMEIIKRKFFPAKE